MKKKILSKILTLGVLINSIPINSLAGTLSEDGRYETFQGNNITVNDILEEDKTDIKIEGETLVNLVKDISTIGSGNPIMTNTGNIYTTTTRNNGSAIFKINTNYDISEENITLIFNYSSTDGIYDNKYLGYYGSNQWANYITKLKEGLNIINYTIPKDGDYNYIWIGEVKRELSSNVAQTISNLMVLKGDWTNRDIPGYFEGIQSSFEDQLVTQEMVDSGEEKVENLGKYKVEVKSTGKNLFAKWFNGGLNTTDGREHQGENALRTDFIPIDNCNNYYISGLYNGARSSICYYDANYNFIRRTAGNPVSDIKLIGNRFESSQGETTVYIPEECSFIRLTQYITTDLSGTKQDILDNTKTLQIEEGSVATEYEPYKESINTFYLNSPLLEGDTIDYINGQAYHVRRSKKIVFDGSDDEKWVVNPDKSFLTVSSFTIVDKNANEMDDNNFVLCDKFKIGSKNMEYEGIDFVSSNNLCYINILKSKLKTDDVKGFKEWLFENPVSIKYKLNTSVYEPIKADLSVQLFGGTTHISNNSTILANMKVTVDRTLNRAIEAIELAKINPTIDNLSKARMWTNLVKESIKKDELQSEINNITDIQDLELERKTVSANVDIYIKSDNSLSMTLSTNSIMFEDYSGVSDIEKLNALEITVNSSLPYDLNAYLESEIQNNDKSTTIDSNLLQIKESSNLDYKTFNNTSDKVILEEDCPSGNYNKHNIDLKMEGSNAYKTDVYKTVIKFEAEQK